jgi:hypothetical protein
MVESNTKVPLSMLVEKINTRKDAQQFCQYIGRNITQILGKYMPLAACFDSDFFLDFISGSKKVYRLILNI